MRANRVCNVLFENSHSTDRGKAVILMDGFTAVKEHGIVHRSLRTGQRILISIAIINRAFPPNRKSPKCRGMPAISCYNTKTVHQFVAFVSFESLIGGTDNNALLARPRFRRRHQAQLWSVPLNQFESSIRHLIPYRYEE